MNRTQGGDTTQIRNHETKGEIATFEPCYTRLSPTQFNNVVLPSPEVSMYLDKALKVLGLVGTLSVGVPCTNVTAY